MRISFMESLTKTLDLNLSSKFNKYVCREDVLSFVHKLQSYISINTNKDGSGHFENHKIRNEFGLLSINKKRVWKVDLIIDLLKTNKIIDYSSYDKTNGKTRFYWFNEEFINQMENFEIKIIEEELPAKYFDKYFTEPKDKDAKLQYNLLMSKRFSVDVKSAIELINNYQFTDSKYTDHTDEQKQNIKLSMYQSILNLNDKIIYSTRGENGNRIFTSFNGLKRELRQFCYIDGKQLKEIDLKSSQPFIIASYLISKVHTEDVERFYNLVTNDDVYTYFLNKWNEQNPQGFFYLFNPKKNKNIKKYLKERNDAKPEFLKLLFKSSGKLPQFWNILYSDFPTVAKFIETERLKVATFCQMAESDLFIPVCSKLVKKGCLSIHDSLAYTIDIEEEVKNELYKRFEELGYRDYTLKTEK